MLQHLAGLAAAAATDNPGKQLGENFKNLVQGFSVPVYLAVLMCMAIGYMFGRKLPQFAVFLIGAIGIGILVFNPEGFGHMVNGIGDFITRGVS
jgi:hypothetical protein